MHKEFMPSTKWSDYKLTLIIDLNDYIFLKFVFNFLVMFEIFFVLFKEFHKIFFLRIENLVTESSEICKLSELNNSSMELSKYLISFLFFIIHLHLILIWDLNFSLIILFLLDSNYSLEYPTSNNAFMMLLALQSSKSPY